MDRVIGTYCAACTKDYEPCDIFHLYDEIYMCFECWDVLTTPRVEFVIRMSDMFRGGS